MSDGVKVHTTREQFETLDVPQLESIKRMVHAELARTIAEVSTQEFKFKPVLVRQALKTRETELMLLVNKLWIWS